MNSKSYDEYYEQLEKLKKICSKLDKAPNYLSLSQKYGLRSSRWFVEHCKNKKVKDYNTFMEYEVGIRPNYNESKDSVSKNIFLFIENFGRSPKRSDFDKGILKMSTGTIQRIFGSIRKMQKELGIPLNKSIGGTERKKTIHQIKTYINKFLKTKKENIFSIDEINDFFRKKNIEITYQTINKRFLNTEGYSIRNYVNTKGFDVVKPGMGIFHIYEDGELSYSYHEKVFSKILRENKFVFNSSYFRDVKYSDLFNDVENNFTLDYLILHGNRKIYMEVAGMLRDHKNNYNEKIIINSESKEKYRLSLLKKEEILKKNNVEYFIIFPNKYKNLEEIVYGEIYFLNKRNEK